MVPVVDAIGTAYREHLVDYTLIESGAHPPASDAGYPPAAAPGRPPMLMTGRLRDTVVKTPAAGGGGFAECSVFPTVIYAATIQWGAVHTGAPIMVLWKRYVGYGTARDKGWLKREVTIKPHPYMNTAVDESIANGKLSRAATGTFDAVVWGR
jgi:hypothetical protein